MSFARDGGVEGHAGKAVRVRSRGCGTDTVRLRQHARSQDPPIGPGDERPDSLPGSSNVMIRGYNDHSPAREVRPVIGKPESSPARLVHNTNPPRGGNERG